MHTFTCSTFFESSMLFTKGALHILNRMLTLLAGKNKPEVFGHIVLADLGQLTPLLSMQLQSSAFLLKQLYLCINHIEMEIRYKKVFAPPISRSSHSPVLVKTSIVPKPPKMPPKLDFHAQSRPLLLHH